MFKLIVLVCFFFSSFSHAKEFIVQLKPGHKLDSSLKSLAKRQFKVLGQDYLVVENVESLGFFSKSIKKVEENFEVYAFDLDENGKMQAPRLSDFSKQWALQNLGNSEPVSTTQMSPLQGVVGADLNMLEAWKITKGEKDIVIAVIDTGVNYDHKELQDNMWVNQAEKNGRRWVDDDGNGFVDDIHGYDFVGDDGKPKDANGHGTHCAGVIGASHTKGKIYGAMKDVSIMAVSMLNHQGRGNLEQAIKAVGYAIDNGADVLSSSWGSRKYSEILENLFKKANEKGIVVVAAAGNSRFNNNDDTPTYPATYSVPNIISVAAYNAQERHAAYSSYGPKSVHVSAPGTNVLSTYVRKRRYKEVYRVASGTSMATPYVSALVGLYLGHHGKGKSPEEIKNILINSSVPASDLADKSVSGGRVDAFRFLTY